MNQPISAIAKEGYQPLRRILKPKDGSIEFFPRLYPVAAVLRAF